MHRSRLIQIVKIGIVVISNLIEVCTLSLCDSDIHTAEQINRLGKLCKVNRHIVGNIHVKILIQCFNCQRCTAKSIGVANFLILMPFNRHITVTQNGRKLYRIVLSVYTDNNDRVTASRKCLFVAGIQAEQRHIKNICIAVLFGNFIGNTQIALINLIVEPAVNTVYRSENCGGQHQQCNQHIHNDALPFL